METTLIQSEVEITMGQRVGSQAFGDGTVAGIDGDIITVRFEDGEDRKLKAEYLQPAETLEQLRNKFRDCWMRGTEWRLEVGELLYNIKRRCAHGEWGDFLGEYELARSTADDYVRRYEDAADITVPRQFVAEPEPDDQADQRKEQIKTEEAKRVGKKPSHHSNELHVRVKALPPDLMERYREERKENRERVDEIWRSAFFQIIGVEQIYPTQIEQDVADVDDEVVPEQEVAQC